MITFVTMRSLPVNCRFKFNGKTYTKINTLGEYIGFMNIRDDDGNKAHIHPSTKIRLFHDKVKG